jgi:hypothetical protein
MTDGAALGKYYKLYNVKVFFFFFCNKEVIFHLVQIHLIIYIWTCHSGHVDIHDQNICIDFCSYKKILNISLIINTFVGICRAERRELLYIEVRPYIAQDVSNLLIVMAMRSKRKATISFDNGVFFYIEAKQTGSIVRKLFSKRSEQVR